MSLYEKAPYDPFKDFDPIAEISHFPVMFTVRPDLGVNTLQELIALAKAEARAAQLFHAGTRHAAASCDRTA